MLYHWTGLFTKRRNSTNIDWHGRDRKVLKYNLKSYFLFYLKRIIEYFWIGTGVLNVSYKYKNYNLLIKIWSAYTHKKFFFIIYNFLDKKN